MNWNLDYDICALLFTSTLIINFNYRKWLPLIRNRLFFLLMCTSTMVALTDVIATIICEKGASFPISLIYISNMIFYIILGFKPVVFTFYIFSLARYPVGRFKYRGDWLLLLPFLATCLIVLSTPFNNKLFVVTAEHQFVYGEFRSWMFYVTALYLFISACVVVANRKNLRKVVLFSILFYIFCSLMGYIYQFFIYGYAQTVSLANTVGILIVFLAFQNPDYDRDRKTGLFRESCIRKMKDEDTLYGVQRSVAEVAFENYSTLKAVYGEEIVSDLSSKVGKYLQEAFPKENQFYVHNGRFVMAFSGGEETVLRYMDMVRKRCQKPFYYGDVSIYLSPVFVYTLDDVEIVNQPILRDSLRLAVELALQKGEGAIVRLTEEIYQKAIRNIKVEKALKTALNRNNLLVYYQPIYSTMEKRVTGAEALVRIYDEELGLLYPDEFITMAEENGSILMLGNQVFRQVCDFVQNHDMDGLGLSFIEVNLSPFQCMRENLAQELEIIMKEHGVNPKYIGLEITESAASNIEIVKTNMDYLVELGVKMALDDYGTGYSNLINILSLPFHVVKIDKSIVWAYFNDENDFLLRVIQTFQNRDLRLVVEGVETEEMAETLGLLGCHYEQGYYYSKPVPPEEFVRYVEEKQWNRDER